MEYKKSLGLQQRDVSYGSNSSEEFNQSSSSTVSNNYKTTITTKQLEKMYCGNRKHPEVTRTK